MGISVEITGPDTWGVDNLDWLLTRKGFDTCRTVTLDLSLFKAEHVALGYIKSGIVLSKKTSTGFYGPYTNFTDSVQSLTIGGAGLTSFTVTFGGQTTASIAAAATAATVQTALQALSSIGSGNILVTGNAGGPYTLTFYGSLANVAQTTVTTTPTGGTGTVTAASVTTGGVAGASDGSQIATGHLLTGVRTVDSQGTSFAKAVAPMLWEGVVLRSKLPAYTTTGNGFGMLDTTAETALKFVRYEG